MPFGLPQTNLQWGGVLGPSPLQIPDQQPQQQGAQQQAPQTTLSPNLGGFFNFLRETNQLDFGLRGGFGGGGGFGRMGGFQQAQTPLTQFLQGFQEGEIQDLSTEDLIDRFNAFTAELNPPNPLDPTATEFRFQPQVDRQTPQVDFSQFGRGPVSPLQQTAFPERQQPGQQQRFQPQVPGNRLANIGR